jgi:antitoxin (DNA-binding transcriptional repressor) of toxin-antitoxin stability system
LHGVPWYDFSVKNQILRLTATEAARDFSRLLDRIEAGDEAIIERHSEPVATISPATLAPRRISECMAVNLARLSSSPDPEFAADLADIIRGNPAVEPPSWD